MKGPNVEIHQLSLIDKAILNSVIGQKILHFCIWENNKKNINYMSLTTENKNRKGEWVYIAPQISSSEDEYMTLKIFTDEIYPMFKEFYNTRTYYDSDQLRINEIVQDIKIITDIYTINKNNQNLKLIIDSGLIFEFPDFSVIVNAENIMKSALEIKIYDVSLYKNSVDLLDVSKNSKCNRKVYSIKSDTSIN